MKQNKKKPGPKPKENRDEIKERLPVFIEKWKTNQLGKDQAKKIAYTAITEACGTKIEHETFVCKHCTNELPSSYQIKTEGYCYLCDPNLTAHELYNFMNG